MESTINYRPSMLNTFCAIATTTANKGSKISRSLFESRIIRITTAIAASYMGYLWLNGAGDTSSYVVQPLVIAAVGTGLKLAKELFFPEKQLNILTTGYLRFVQIWADVIERKLHQNEKNVLILGAGSQVIDNVPHCPQVFEALKIWKNSSTINVLDCDEHVLKQLKNIDYDKSNECIETTYGIALNKRYSGKKVLYHDVDSILLGKKTRKLPKINLIKCNVGQDPLPKSLHNLEVIVATWSLLYPLENIVQSDHDGSRRIEILADFVKTLTPGGVMYVDDATISMVTLEAKKTRRVSGMIGIDRDVQPDINKLQNSLSSRVGFEVRIKRLPAVMGKKVNTQAMIFQPTPPNLLKKGQLLWVITSDVWAIEHHPQQG